jgi:hypothetical protein
MVDKELTSKLKNCYPEEADLDQVDRYINESIEEIWADTEGIVLSSKTHKRRHHVSETYINQWRKDFRLPDNDLPFMYEINSDDNTIEKNRVYAKSSQFIYEKSDKLRYSDRLEVFLSRSVEYFVSRGFENTNRFFSEQKKCDTKTSLK